MKRLSYEVTKLLSTMREPVTPSLNNLMTNSRTLMRSRHGTTLIETLIALALASVVLTAVVSMVITAVSTAATAKSRTTATRYAEEGIEVTRRARDENLWANFYKSYVGGTTWHVDPNYNLTTGSGLDLSPFQRGINITDSSVPNGAKNRVQVVVKVSWSDKGKTQTVQLDTYLSEWSH